VKIRWITPVRDLRYETSGPGPYEDVDRTVRVVRVKTLAA
jgi:hypothetical protein